MLTLFILPTLTNTPGLRGHFDWSCDVSASVLLVQSESGSKVCDEKEKHKKKNKKV